MSMNTDPATVTIKPHPREVVREFLEACKNYGSNNFYEEVIAELNDQLGKKDVDEAISWLDAAEGKLLALRETLENLS